MIVTSNDHQINMNIPRAAIASAGTAMMGIESRNKAT